MKHHQKILKEKGVGIFTEGGCQCAFVIIQVTMITLSLQIQLLKRFNKKVPKVSDESGFVFRDSCCPLVEEQP